MTDQKEKTTKSAEDARKAMMQLKAIGIRRPPANNRHIKKLERLDRIEEAIRTLAGSLFPIIGAHTIEEIDRILAPEAWARKEMKTPPRSERSI